MPKNLSPVFSLILIAVMVWFSFYSSRPKVVGTTETSEINFYTERAFEHVEAIAQKPHYVGSSEHSRVRNYIVNQLQTMNLEVQTQEAYSLTKNGTLVRPQNILSRIRGNGSGKALVLMTHYDSNPHSSPGASDAASGVGAILEGIRAFKAQNKEHQNDIIILFTDAEELGLNGADLFVKDHPWAEDVGLALNFEARGSGGDSFMFLETDEGNAGLIKSFKKAKPEYPVTNSFVYSIYKMLPNDTDLTVFREQGNINGFNFAFIDHHYNYHTANDTPENLDKKSLAHQGSYLMPLLDYFKDYDLEKTRAEKDLLFFSLPGGELISYPFSWNFPLLLFAAILFFLLVIYGFRQKKIDLKMVLKGFLAFFIALFISGILVFLLWKFCLFIYPQYLEMEHGFTYNGYYYIAAFIFLSLSIAFFTYHNFPTTQNTHSLFVAPLFFWLLICSLLVYFLPGAAYFIIPAYFALLQLFVMIRQKQPISLLMAFLGLPAIFILLPFISMFPVALGLNILYVSALLCVLLFMLLLPVFGYLRRKKALALLCFLVFNILFITAHFKSDFNEERPKPNSLVYLFNADENTAHFRSYDNLPDEWTQQIFGAEPVIIPSEEKTFGSKYGSDFTWHTEAPKITLVPPTIILDSLDSQNDIIRFSLKFVPNRKVNRVDLYADPSLDFEFFEANNLKAESTSLGEQEFHIHTRRWQDRLLTWHVSARDTLHLEFSLQRDMKPEFTLYESSYDLLRNEELNIEPRTKAMIPRPFVLNDAVIFKKTIKMD